MSTPKARPKRPTWFQDVKSGCEKQTDYFMKIRKLQKELINREQHNLVNAMERLKQLQYPRRKPVIRNFAPQQVTSSSGFPKRPLNARQVLKRQRQSTDGEVMIKPLKGKHLLPNRNHHVEEEITISLEDIKLLYRRMLPVLDDNQIAKIVHEVRETFPNEPSTYLLQPHLPSIPNVKRKTNARLENRLKLLTLANESEYITIIPKIATPLLLHRQNESDESLAASPEPTDTKSTVKKVESKRMLNFDVDPNDSSVFTHSTFGHKNTDYDDDTDDDVIIDNKDDGTGPLPPPNSRPGSYNKPTVDNGSNVTEAGSSVSLVDGHMKENNPKAPDSAVEEVSEEHQSIVPDISKDNDKPKEVVDTSVTEGSELHDDQMSDQSVSITEPKVTIINMNM